MISPPAPSDEGAVEVLSVTDGVRPLSPSEWLFGLPSAEQSGKLCAA